MSRKRAREIRQSQVTQEQEDRYIEEKLYGLPNVWERAESAQRATILGLNLIELYGERCRDRVFDLFHLKVKWHNNGWTGRDERNVMLNPLGGDKGYMNEGELAIEIARRCILSVQGTYKVLVTNREIREDAQQDLCQRILLFLRFILPGGIAEFHKDKKPTTYRVTNPTSWLTKVTRNLMADTLSPYRSHHKKDAMAA